MLTQRRIPRTVLGCVSLILLGGAAACVVDERDQDEALGSTEAALTAASLRVSTSASRSSAVSLDGQRVSGTIYVFTSPTRGVGTVDFYLDDPTRARPPVHTERAAPFD